MIKYINWYGLEKDVAEAFVDIVREMDNAYISYHNKEQEKKAELTKSRAKN